MTVIRYHVFIPCSNRNGCICHSFDTAKEANHFAGMFQGALIKEFMA